MHSNSLTWKNLKLESIRDIIKTAWVTISSFINIITWVEIRKTLRFWKLKIDKNWITLRFLKI